jgi:hypothetical protein
MDKCFELYHTVKSFWEFLNNCVCKCITELVSVVTHDVLKCKPIFFFIVQFIWPELQQMYTRISVSSDARCVKI